MVFVHVVISFLVLYQNRWAEMFPCLIARASTTDVISSGMGGTRNGTIQLVSYWQLGVLVLLGFVLVLPATLMESNWSMSSTTCMQMRAELQVLSPLVPIREVNFLRFCKQHAEGVWAVVDVSIDGIRETPTASSYTNCRRLPSGCVVQDMPNGYTKVSLTSTLSRHAVP